MAAKPELEANDFSEQPMPVFRTVEANQFAKLFAAKRRTRPFGSEQLSSSGQGSRASLGSQTALRLEVNFEVQHR
jgi:hypothetical protein